MQLNPEAESRDVGAFHIRSTIPIRMIETNRGTTQSPRHGTVALQPDAREVTPAFFAPHEQLDITNETRKKKRLGVKRLLGIAGAE